MSGTRTNSQTACPWNKKRNTEAACLETFSEALLLVLTWVKFSMLVSSKKNCNVDYWIYWIFLNFSFQGLEIVFRVGLALLQMNQAELLQLDMEGMLQVSYGYNNFKRPEMCSVCVFPCSC